MGALALMYIRKHRDFPTVKLAAFAYYDIQYHDKVKIVAHSLYNRVFAHIAGHENVGWFVKDESGQIVKADASGRFARIAALDEAQLLGATTADLPWSNAVAQVDETDGLVLAGEVKEAVGVYWHPLDKQWCRVVCAKWLVREGSEDNNGDKLIYCMVMDITGVTYRPYDSEIFFAHVEVDWDKECVIVGKNILTRAHTVCLSYYLDQITQAQIADHTAVTVKTVEKRIAHLKNTLLPLDRSCENLYMFCRKYGIRSALEAKRDWFDQQAVIWPITHGQWAGNLHN